MVDKVNVVSQRRGRDTSAAGCGRSSGRTAGNSIIIQQISEGQTTAKAFDSATPPAQLREAAQQRPAPKQRRPGAGTERLKTI
jgi:hypothetical protein